jgi:OOP family OmpA-OmpF porin
MVRVEVQGHTDNVGAAEANRNLSAQRAEAVRQYLIGAGVEAGRMTAVGYGEDLPVADNTTDAGRQANRRVDLVRTDR